MPLHFFRFVLNCTALPPEEVLGGKLVLHTQMIHKYLPPVDVDITVEFGGGVDLPLQCIV